MRVLAVLLWTFVSLGSAGAQQLLLIQRTWTINASSQSSDCLAVGRDGSYHFERTPLDLGRPGQRQIHVGKLSDDEMKQLTAMLNDPALQSLTTPKPAPGFMTGGPDFELLWVLINRDGQSQFLNFDDTAGGNKISAGNRLPSVYQTAAMKPLMNWYKQISKRKDDIDKTAAPTCSIEVRQR